MSASTKPKLAQTLGRCTWAGDDPLYIRYHDEEWGVPQTDDRALFEKLILEGFQAGLSWITILRKRETFRRVFHGFDPEQIARYTEKDTVRLMAEEGIVRSRAKIEATIHNARMYLKLAETTTLCELIWDHIGGKPIINARAGPGEVPPQTAQSQALSKTLKAHGFKFVGPTTAYAFMQAMGMVNDHLVSCHRHEPCAKLQRAMSGKGRSEGRR